MSNIIVNKIAQEREFTPDVHERLFKHTEAYQKKNKKSENLTQRPKDTHVTLAQ